MVKSGDPHTVLSELISSGAANAIFAEGDTSPYARQRDARISADLPLTLAGSAAILPPGAVLKNDGAPYTVFTPFSRAWLGIFASGGGAPIPPPDRINTPESILGQPIPTTPASLTSTLFPPGEQAALRRLEAFTSGEAAGIYRYAQDRNRLGPGRHLHALALPALWHAFASSGRPPCLACDPVCAGQQHS